MNTRLNFDTQGLQNELNRIKMKQEEQNRITTKQNELQRAATKKIEQKEFELTRSANVNNVIDSASHLLASGVGPFNSARESSKLLLKQAQQNAKKEREAARRKKEDRRNEKEEARQRAIAEHVKEAHRRKEAEVSGEQGGSWVSEEY